MKENVNFVLMYLILIILFSGIVMGFRLNGQIKEAKDTIKDMNQTIIDLEEQIKVKDYELKIAQDSKEILESRYAEEYRKKNG